MARRYRSRSVFADRQSSGFGRRLLQFLFLLILIGAVGLVLYLGFADYGPAPETVEREIPLDNLRQ
ncbi:MAG: hypothetical protein RLO50_12370 [Azospirillaceae bacterium]